MAERLKLHQELCELIGSKNVYFDPPENIKLKYPCFIYESDVPFDVKANNHSYFFMKRYSVTYIDTNPDNDMTEKMLKHFMLISAGNPYVSDNIHHYPFDIYY
jgi:hypothetical protein